MQEATPILMIEDNINLANMYKKKFEKEKMKVNILNNGEGLAKKVASQDPAPQIILLDIMMPNMDGIETLKLIKGLDNYEPKIIIFSNLDDKETIQECRSLGIQEYIVKSNITPKELVNKIRDILN